MFARMLATRLVAVLSLVFVVAAFASLPARAAEVEAHVTSATNAYTGPGGAYPVAFTIPANGIVMVIGCNQDYSWCQGRYQNQIGWIVGSQLVANQGNQPVGNVGGALGLAIFDFILDQLGVPQPQPPQPQPQPPGVIPGPNEICFYTEANFVGTAFCATMGQSNASLISPWNDVISSIRVGDGAQVEVCGGANYTDWCQIYADDVNLTSIRNNTTSSYRTVGIGQQPQPPAPQPQGPGPNDVCFYSDPNFAGSAFCAVMGQSNANLGAPWNDVISSIRIGANATVQVCGGPNYTDWCQIYADDVNLTSIRNNSISSYRTTGFQNPQPQPQPQPGGQVFARPTVALNARSGPGTNFPVQFVVSTSTQVQVYECTLQWSWCHIRTPNNQTAWASSQYLRDTVYQLLISDIGDDLGLPLVAAPAAPAPQAPPTPTANQVCFYLNASFAGNAFCVTAGQVSTQLTSPWNNAISSIRVGSNASVQVCGDPNYGDWCQTYTDNVSLTSFRDNSISSYRTMASGAPPASDPTVCVYDGWNYTGAAFCFGPGQTFATLPTGWSNRISSIRVDPGLSVQVCEQTNFLGWCEQYTGNTAQLTGTRDNNISSMRTP